MALVIYKGNTFYHVGNVTLRAGVNQVSEKDMAYLLAHPHFRQRVNLGIIDCPDLPRPAGKDLTKNVEETLQIIARMNDFKVLQSISKYDSRREVMEAAEKRVNQLKEKAASTDISLKHYKGLD